MNQTAKNQTASEEFTSESLSEIFRKKAVDQFIQPKNRSNPSSAEQAAIGDLERFMSQHMVFIHCGKK